MSDEENLYTQFRRFETETASRVIEVEQQLRLAMRDFVFQADVFTASAHSGLRKGAAKMWPDLPVRVRRIEEISDYIRFKYLPFVRRVPWWRRFVSATLCLPPPNEYAAAPPPAFSSDAGSEGRPSPSFR